MGVIHEEDASHSWPTTNTCPQDGSCDHCSDICRINERRQGTVSMRITCLDGPHRQTVHTPVIIASTQKGLGKAVENNKPFIHLRLNMTPRQFHRKLTSFFPVLENVPYQLCKSDNFKSLIPLPSCADTPLKIKRVGLGRSQLYIRPNVVIEGQDFESEEMDGTGYV